MQRWAHAVSAHRSVKRKMVRGQSIVNTFTTLWTKLNDAGHAPHLRNILEGIALLEAVKKELPPQTFR